MGRRKDTAVDRLVGADNELIDKGRRRALAAIAGGAGLLVGSSHALAQRWLETLPGFGGNARGDRRPRPAPASAEAQEINDLRPSSVPWRSDTMLESLDAAIGRYERLAAKGGWPRVPRGRLVRPGDDDERVSDLRRMLVLTGDLKATEANRYSGGYGFDDGLELGVRRFQRRHGLRATGRLDRPTQAQVDVSAQARLAQLKLNRQRVARLLETRVEDRYVLVNVAAFQLEAVEQWEVQQRHRVIAGKPDRQTPEIQATIKALNFFPYWRVPKSVATLDLIPRLQKEPEYLEKEHIKVYDGYLGKELDPRQVDWTTADGQKLWFRQEPGEHNALGLVRIDMPNPEIVYMHDTPMKPLFKQSGRAFSAGCVRVEGVFQLVEWIARYEPGFEEKGRVQAVLDAGQPVDVNLTRPIPVYFTYLTAWAERDGTIEFRPDIYNRDGYKDLVGEHDPDAPPPPRMLAP
ncbi:MAG: L,D-transpeptidase family protein [Hyphomicrobiaceae bacterium]